MIDKSRTDNIDTPTFTHLDQHSSSGAIPLDHYLCTLLEGVNIKNAHHCIVFDNLEGMCDGSILLSNALMLMIWFCVAVSVFCINFFYFASIFLILHLSPVKLELSNWQVPGNTFCINSARNHDFYRNIWVSVEM